MTCRFGRLFQTLQIIAVAVLFLTIGCGKDGNQISGTVNFNGQPVPAGKIYFTPDSSKGNSGSAGFADIIDGKYDTSLPGGRGASSGAMVVAIEGIDPNRRPTGAEEDVVGTVLFPRYETSVEIAGGDAVQNFDVPPEAADGPKQPEGAKYISP